MRSIVWESSSPNNSGTLWQLDNWPNRGVIDMRIQAAAIGFGLVFSLTVTACTTNKVVPASDPYTEQGMPAPSTAVANVPNDPRLPADASGGLVRLSSSPRHGEWVVLHTGDGDSLRAWVVYPERSTKAPVVVVVHEIFGLSSWIRGVSDQLAAAGFIALAPDLLTLNNLPEDPHSAFA